MRKNRRHTRENRILKALIRAATGAAARDGPEARDRD